MSSPLELSFPVPWGHISAVAWGNPQERRVLMVHGTLDNAGSFKRLIAHLPDTYYCICIDLPGHGLSSHFPPGMNLDFMNFVLAIHYVLEELEWENCLYIGHSFGGQLGVIYSILYPERLERIIAIDVLIPRAVRPQETVQILKTIHETTLFALKKQDANLYTKKEIIEAIMNKRRFKINRNAAEALFERAVTQIGDKFKYNRDVRLRPYVALMLTEEQNTELMDNMKTQVLLIIATDSWYHQNNQMDIIRAYEAKYSGYLSKITVEGNHDIHNNTPEIIAPHIIEFFASDRKSKL